MSIDVFEQFFFLVVLSRKLMGYTCFARPSRTALASSTLAVITMVCDKCPFPLTVFLHIPPCASPSLSPLLPTAPLRSFPCSACLGRPRSSSLLPGFWVGADSRPVVSDLRLLWSPPLCPLRASVGLPLRRLVQFWVLLSSLCLLRVASIASVLSPCPLLCVLGGWVFMCCLLIEPK